MILDAYGREVNKPNPFGAGVLPFLQTAYADRLQAALRGTLLMAGPSLLDEFGRKTEAARTVSGKTIKWSPIQNPVDTTAT